MRRTRTSKNRAIANVLALLVIAVVLVGSGYLIGKFLLSSLLQKTPGGEPVSTPGNNDTPGAETTTVQIQLKALNLYRVQIGAFSSLENAEKVAQSAMEKNVGAAVMTPDPLFKVYCGIVTSKDAANKISDSALPKLAGSVIGKDDKLYVSTFSVPSRTFNLTGDKAHVELMQQAFSKIDNALGSLASYWDSFYLGQQSQVNISSMETDIAALKEQISNITPASGLTGAHSCLATILAELDSSVKNAKEAAGGDSRKVSLGMVSFVKLIDTYVQQIDKMGS
jgi:hypothetical protein